jgi:hypothetical protein
MTIATTDPHARSADPETSHESAALLTDSYLARYQRMVLGYIRARGKVAHFQIADYFSAQGYPDDVIRPRVAELRRKGLVRDSTERGLSPAGRKVILWEAVTTEP